MSIDEWFVHRWKNRPRWDPTNAQRPRISHCSTTINNSNDWTLLLLLLVVPSRWIRSIIILPKWLTKEYKCVCWSTSPPDSTKDAKRREKASRQSLEDVVQHSTRSSPKDWTNDSKLNNDEDEDDDIEPKDTTLTIDQSPRLLFGTTSLSLIGPLSFDTQFE